MFQDATRSYNSQELYRERDIRRLQELDSMLLQNLDSTIQTCWTAVGELEKKVADLLLTKHDSSSTQSQLLSQVQSQVNTQSSTCCSNEESTSTRDQVVEKQELMITMLVMALQVASLNSIV
ncbi:hypothetical protein P9112_010307 [Eukaryota sp. TZLM1-RC]